MKPVNLRPVTGHVVKEDSARNPVPEGRGIALINPHTQQVVMLSRSAAAQATAYAATRSRSGRAKHVKGSR